MAGAVGFVFAFAGFVAALAGLTARRRARRLRRSGETAWAIIVPSRAASGDPGEPAARTPRRHLVQYPLADGRVMEQLCPRPLRNATSPRVGERVPVWYDPADPTDVLVNGWDGRLSDRVFLAVGLCFIIFGLAVAFGH
jgi:hypothetical protein